MSTYDWVTPMRATDPPRTDKLIGQAGAVRHEDGRLTLVVMPDRGCFSSSVTISAEDAAGLAALIRGGEA